MQAVSGERGVELLFGGERVSDRRDDLAIGGGAEAYGRLRGRGLDR